MKRIAIIGAGVGGLATAARLSHAGYAVEVFEKLPRCGGRNHMLEDQGFKFDMGPSFVLMPDFFKEVFDSCQENIQDHLQLKTLDIHYKIFFPDDRILTVYQDTEKTKQELEKFEPQANLALDAFLEKTRKYYETVQPLLYRCFTPKAIFHPKNWKLLIELEPFCSYWNLAKKFFKSEELCYAFTFEAMFMGVSPFEAPGFYSVITYADHVQKIAHPMGGMYEIPLALEKIAKKNSAQFHYNSEVKSVYPQGTGVTLQVAGQPRNFDQVVINADYPYAQANLLKRDLADYRYSCSVFLLYLGLSKKIKGLDHHNLFFANDLRKNLQDIFEKNITPPDPSFYVHVPTVTDPSLAPKGKDIVYILVPVANLKDREDDILKEEKRLKNFVYQKINKVIGTSIEEMIEVEHKFYPKDFIDRYNIKYGSTFGLAHNLFQSAFFRPANQDPRHQNIYYVGASTQPGGGLPVVLASSKIVADKIIHSG